MLHPARARVVADRRLIFEGKLPVGKWHEYLAEPTVADAILDRIVPKAHPVELNGKSLHKRPEHFSS